jgi:hypothetical protein
MPEPIDMVVLYHMDDDPPTATMVIDIPLDRYKAILTSIGTKQFAQNMIDGFGAALVGHDLDLPYMERQFVISPEKDEEGDD